ncbi:MAG: UPF0182 family protein, partial [Acidimicrobiales bacterium]
PGPSSAPVRPVYEMLRLPGATARSLGLVAVEPLVPYSQDGRTQTLSAFVVASCSPGSYGRLTAYVIPREGHPVQGPALVLNQIAANAKVSKEITALDQHGSRVELGPTIMIPVDSSLLYVRTLYLRSVTFSAPLVQDVIVDYAGKVAMAPTLLGDHGALSLLFGQAVSAIGSEGEGSISPLVRQLLHDAVIEYRAAQQALKTGDLSTFSADIKKVGEDITTAESYLQRYQKSPRAASSHNGASSTRAGLPARASKAPGPSSGAA